MNLHLILIALSSSAWAYMGWYVIHRDPKSAVNRSCAAWSLFVSAWSFVILAYAAGLNEAETAWYAGELFSYLPKSILYLSFILHLTGMRSRVPRLVFVFLYALAAGIVVLGICFFLSLPIGLRAYELLVSTGAEASPLRGAYAALAIVLYSASAGLLVIWNRVTKLKREKRLSIFFLAVLGLVVGVHALLGLFKSRMGNAEVDFLIALQLIHAFPVVLAVDHYRSMSPIERIVADQMRTQLAFPVTIVDTKGLIVSANAAAVELSGKSAESLVGMSFESLLGESGRLTLDAEGPSFLEVIYASNGGGAMPMSLSVTPVKDRWGDSAGYVLVGHPIKRLLERQKELGLSEREREVCILLIQGLTNQEIGDRLFISPGTVKNHVYNIYEKTGVKNRVELSQLFS